MISVAKIQLRINFQQVILVLIVKNIGMGRFIIIIEEKFRLAELLQRLLALLIDAVLVNLPLFIVLGVLLGFNSVMQALVAFIYLIYSITLPVFWNGYVVGKKIMNARIVQDDGSKVTFVNMLLRELSAFVIYFSVIGLVVSICMVALREDRRSIHDFIGGTIVLDEPAHGFK